MLTRFVEVEISEPLQPIYLDPRYHRLGLVGCWHGRPLGTTFLDPARGERNFSAEQVRTAVLRYFGMLLWEQLACGALEGTTSSDGAPLPPVSVIVCTRDRPLSLESCLRALAELDYPSYEVLVIDNCSRGDEVVRVVRKSGFRYVREDRPGLDWARNRGIAEARHDLIAFTDDDATVCRNWLRAMARAFADEEVMGVTGLVLPAELETPSQMWFQRYGGMGKGFAARRFCGVSIGPREMMAAQEVGVGANMVFRRCVFHKIGGFDTRLDVGTPSRGGGDLDIFHRVLSAGLTIHYEPAAFAWHRDRRDMNGLRTQIYNNGCSYGVYLLKVLRNGSVPRLEAMDYAFRWAAGWVLWRFLRGLTRPRYFPLGLLGAELRGALHAPAAYRASARQDCLVRAAGSLSKNPEDGKPHA